MAAVSFLLMGIKVSAQELGTSRKEVSTDSGAGSVIPGYSILARIGRGGMGAVFKAIQLSMHRLVALKILPISLAKDKTYIRRFLREAKSAAQMNHPNLTRVYDVGSYRGVFYFSMEFVEGAPLLDLIKSESRVDVETATDIVLQAARGLRHAHSHSIVHRDIKPENIMISVDGTVKITDMGLAKRIDSADHDITVTGQVIGTPCYMSPEQITDPKSVDPRSDIYSLGSTFYHMVTGRRPFQGDTSAQTLLMVVGEDPEWPRGEIPVSVLRVIKKMMAKDPARRHQSADDLIAELLYLKERIFSPHRSRRLAFITSLSSPSPGAASGEAAAIVQAPSRKLTMALAVASLIVVLGAVLFQRGSEAESASFDARMAAIPAVPANLSFEEYFERGKKLGEEGRWVEALAWFDRAVAADSNSHEAWNNHGTCLWHLRRFEGAVDSYNRALDLNYEAVDTHINRGAALLELDRLLEALDEFESATNLAPDSKVAWKGKAIALRRLDRLAEAVEAESKANRLNK
jgi:serine/threonine protein kinase